MPWNQTKHQKYWIKHFSSTTFETALGHHIVGAQSCLFPIYSSANKYTCWHKWHSQCHWVASSIFKKQVVVELALNCWLTNLYNCQKTPVGKYYSGPYKPTTILRTKAADFSKKLGSVERPCRPRSCCDVCTAFPVSPARSLCTENKFLQFRMRNFPGS